MRGTGGRILKASDVFVGATVGGSVIGVLLMAFGAWLLAVASTGNITAIDARNALVEGSVFFAVGGAFLLVSAILIPALRAIRREDSHPP